MIAMPIGVVIIWSRRHSELCAAPRRTSHTSLSGDQRCECSGASACSKTRPVAGCARPLMQVRRPAERCSGVSAAAPTGFPTGLEVALVGGPPTLAREVVKVLRGEGIEVWVADTLDGLRDVCGDRRPHVAVQLSAGPLTARSRLLASVSRHRDRMRVVLVRGGIRDAELRAALDPGVA